jgi:hypothetical protein
MDTVYIGQGAVESLGSMPGVNMAGLRAEFRNIKHGGGGVVKRDGIKGASPVSDIIVCDSPALTWRLS